MGVVIRRYIVIITFPYSTCISSFFGSIIPTSLVINPRRACAERVTVVVSLTLGAHAQRGGKKKEKKVIVSCVCVCVSVCLMYVCPNTLFWQYAQLEV